MRKQRQIELDILRIVAMLAVILAHVCGMEVKKLPVTDVNWKILVILHAVLTWEVPAFVMISGRFFLDPERKIDSAKLVKAISRLIFAFLVWDVIYQLYYIIAGSYEGLNWKGILSQTLIGPYHFWYLFMLVLLYAITPFLRKIAEDKKLSEYFLLLFVLFSFLTEYGCNAPYVGATLREILDKSKFYFVLGYPGYYLLGYYLYKYGVPRKLELPIYIAALLLLICAACGNLFRSIQVGAEEERYTRYLLPNIIIESAAVYTFCVKRLSKLRFSERTVRWISVLSDYSFGVYLIHALIIEFVAHIGLKPTLINPLVMAPALSILVYLLSHLTVVVLRKIPVIGNRIT